MNKRIMTAILFLLIISIFTGCAMPFKASSQGKNKSSDSADNNPEGDTVGDSRHITLEEDERIKTLINDFFSSLYAEPAESYYTYSVSGRIPECIRRFMSKDTISLAEGNIEIGVHLPRFIEANGLVCIDYELVVNRSADGSIKPDIKASLAGEIGQDLLYYTKVNLFAKCVDIHDFESLYFMEPEERIWKPADVEIDGDMADTIRLQARYDIRVKKEEGNYKLTAVREAVTTSSTRTRLLIFNNDFITRLPYLDCTKDQGDENFLNERDAAIYDSEKTLITEFFTGLRESLNADNMKLLQMVWGQDGESFASFLGEISKAGEDRGKRLDEFISINEDYRSMFDYRALPLQMNMERLGSEFKKFDVIPHPGYSKKQKVYSVEFDVPVIKMNGTAEGDEFLYRFDYFVTLAEENSRLKIESIRLNEYSRCDYTKEG